MQQLRIFDITTEKGYYKQRKYEEGLNSTLNDIFPNWTTTEADANWAI